MSKLCKACRDYQHRSVLQTLTREQRGHIKQLLTYRIIKEKLLYVIGMPKAFADEELLSSQNFFGQYGKLERIVINRGPSKQVGDVRKSYNQQVAVYVHYSKPAEVAVALRVSNFHLQLISVSMDFASATAP